MSDRKSRLIISVIVAIVVFLWFWLGHWLSGNPIFVRCPATEGLFMLSSFAGVLAAYAYYLVQAFCTKTAGEPKKNGATNVH